MFSRNIFLALAANNSEATSNPQAHQKPEANELDHISKNVVTLVKGTERYFFIFDDAGRLEALRTLGRFASNPELNFSWFDAAEVSREIRECAF